MKKIAGLMMIVTAGAVLAMPAMARDRDAGCVPVYAPYGYTTGVRHDVRSRHEVRRVVSPVRANYGRR